jgi:hypothetical protein
LISLYLSLHVCACVVLLSRTVLPQLKSGVLLQKRKTLRATAERRKGGPNGVELSVEGLQYLAAGGSGWPTPLSSPLRLRGHRMSADEDLENIDPESSVPY